MQNDHPEEFDEDLEARRQAELAFLQAIGPRCGLPSSWPASRPEAETSLERIAIGQQAAGITPASELRALAAPLAEAFRPSLRVALDALRADLDAARRGERDIDLADALALLEAVRVFASERPELDEVERLAASVAHAPAGRSAAESGGAPRLREATMTVTATFYEHKDFGGLAETYSRNNTERYRGVRFAHLGNRVTSFRASASAGRAANVYAFTNRDFTGRFASLNVPDGWSCWYSNVGADLNDDIESALLVNRDREEVELDAGSHMRDRIAAEIDDALAGEPVQRSGPPILAALIFPAHDPASVLLRVEINLIVRVDYAEELKVFGIQLAPSGVAVFRYRARVSYDIRFDRQGPQRISANVVWVTTWVEGSPAAAGIKARLHPRAVAAADRFNLALAALSDFSHAIALLRRRSLGMPYLLPGFAPNMPPPSGNGFRKGANNEGATIVIPLEIPRICLPMLSGT